VFLHDKKEQALLVPRIRLKEQLSYEFNYNTRLEPRDINYGGHLGNDILVSLAGSARADALYCLGLQEVNLGDGHTGIIMSDLVVNFRAEAFMFDEIIIGTHIGEFSSNGFRIFHRVSKGEIVIALVETGIKAFNYIAREVAPVPETFLKALAAKQSERST
jgi:4-hydroxybenzoyl-CoA thioesterase